MKSNKVLGWVTLVSVAVLGACGGTSAIGSGDDPGKSGSSSVGGTKSGGEGATANMGGKPTTTGGSSTVGGKEDPGVAGTGATPGTEACKSDKDCPDYGAPCEPCADGTYACNKTYCAPEGYCVHTRDTCSTKCSTNMDCPVPDVPCEACADGSKACPSAACVKGFCETAIPTCGYDDPCKGLSCGAACKACAPGEMCDAAKVGYCNAQGTCQANVPQCGEPNGSCATAKDCGAPPPMCVACGNDSCAAFECIDKKCVFACPPNPEPECKLSTDCPAIDGKCVPCGTTDKCAVPACLAGSCELVCPVK